VGLCCASHLAREGWQVTLLERNPEGHDSCAIGSAGFISPSHFIPLAAPGMIALGLKWMLDSSGPFYVKPRLDGDFSGGDGFFWRAANQERARQAGPVLRDLSLASRQWFDQFAQKPATLLLSKNAGFSIFAGPSMDWITKRGWSAPRANWELKPRCWTLGRRRSESRESECRSSGRCISQLIAI